MRSAGRLNEGGLPSTGASAVTSSLRRRLIRRFPYGLIYAVEPDRIVIVAVAHLHRKPGYWKGRL